MNISAKAGAIALASFLALSAHAEAADEHNVSVGVTAAGAPLGLHGADPVAMVTRETLLEGSAGFTAVHDGVAYYFSSADTLNRFEAEPTAFVPQNGGSCTYGVSVGKKFDGDPKYAAVVDGKLYVFLNADIFELFNKDRAGTIEKAAATWPAIRETPANEL